MACANPTARKQCGSAGGAAVLLPAVALEVLMLMQMPQQDVHVLPGLPQLHAVAAVLAAQPLAPAHAPVLVHLLVL